MAGMASEAEHTRDTGSATDGGGEMIVYVGTTTGAGRAEGIYVFRLDAQTGALAHVQTVTGEHNPSFVALAPGGRTLYAAVRQPGVISGVSAFAIDAASGRLTLLNRQPSGGESPAYVSVHPTGRYVFAANYGSGHVASLPVEDDGRLGEPVSVVQHEGQSVDPRRQTGPHAHFIAPDPSGARVFSCDLGIDRVMIYQVDLETGKLVPNDPPYAQLSSGAGPRHLAFHPSGRFIFVINELDSTLSAFAYDAELGAMRIVDTRSTVPDDFQERNTCAQVVGHPNGRFVYGSNRGHHSIAIFEIDPERGTLRPLGHESTQGKTPRNFNLDPTGSLLLAANQESDTIVAFRVDAETGRLTPTGAVTETPAPVCIVFRPGGA